MQKSGQKNYKYDTYEVFKRTEQTIFSQCFKIKVTEILKGRAYTTEFYLSNKSQIIKNAFGVRC